MAAVFPSSWWVKAAVCTYWVHCLESPGTWSNLYMAVPKSLPPAPEVQRAVCDAQRVTLLWQFPLCPWVYGKLGQAAALLHQLHHGPASRKAIPPYCQG